MKRKLLNILLVILLLVTIPGAIVLASDVTGALYKMGITVSNNGTLANYVATVGNISTPNLIAGNYSNAAVSNVAVQDIATNDVVFMPGHAANLWCFWIETIGADSYVNYNLYTAASTGGTIAYFPDTTGMIVSNNATLNLGNDFEIAVSGFVNTDYVVDKNLVYKEEAFRTYISGATDITSAIYDYDTNYPVVATVAGGNDVVDQTDHTVNMPAGVAVGDLLLVYFASDGTTVIAFAGWVQLFQEDVFTAVARVSAWYRIADGTEGVSMIATTSDNQMTCHTSYRITGYSGVPEVVAATTGNSANPDPPSITPSWGSQTTLWFAGTGYDVGTTTVTGYSYADNQRNDRSSNADGVGLGVCSDEITAVSADPGTFTLSGAQQWDAHTIAVAPAFVETYIVTATGVNNGEHTVKTVLHNNILSIQIDDDVPFTTAAVGVTVAVNNHDWEFFLNNAMPYVYSAEIWN